MSATQLWDAGYAELVSVIPPGAKLTPNSRIKPDELGKIPGMKTDAGWHGYNFLKQHLANRAAAQLLDANGANIGLAAARYPALDLDVKDARLAQAITQLAFKHLGRAPVRLSHEPSRLLVYRAEKPFGRIAAVITDAKGVSHLAELLCQDRQFLVAGMHPSGVPYRWHGSPLWNIRPASLALVDAEKGLAFFHTLAEQLTRHGYLVELIIPNGNGKRPETAPVVAQEDLLAPSLDALRELVEKLPNRPPVCSDWDRYRDIGYAVKAAAGGDEGLPIWLEWVERWEGGSADPELSAADWSRMHPPWRRGWHWLQELATEVAGYNGGVDDFEATEEPPPEAPGVALAAPRNATAGEGVLVEATDAWAARRVAKAVLPRVRYVPETGQWHVWSGAAWAPDRVREAAHLIHEGVLRLSYALAARAEAAPSPAEAKAFLKLAGRMQSLSTARAVQEILTMTPGIAVPASAFDVNPWALNTPAGTVDLRTGEMHPADPAAMHSKSTAVAPAPGEPRLWLRFLRETTGADDALVSYLQRYFGYCLTGLVSEQSLEFCWGPGGNGKTVWAEAMAGCMGDYARVAPMEAFTATSNERHPTDLAGLVGARLVTAEETQAGRRWDEARVKKITGGGAMTARFMRQDFFEFTPTFKLLVIGNHAPAISAVDDAMRRRLHVVPFTRKPNKIDHLLGERLREEYPQILQWGIEGCLKWQELGLTPPEVVVAKTEAFLADEDLLGQWLEEECRFGPELEITRADIYDAWVRWCHRQREDPGPFKAFRRLMEPKLQGRKIRETMIGPKDRRARGYRGVCLRDVDLQNL